MRKYCAFLLLLAFALQTAAQQKQFSYAQTFRGEPTNITKPLPSVVRWIDDDNFILSERRGTELVYTKVNAKTGKTETIPAPENQPSQPTVNARSLGLQDAVNFTLSPDGKWAAYTKKDNNLYAIEIATKKEIQLTNDGSSTILNGYASWVYFEEILGRASRYRAFWWSGDSKTIAFMRFDETGVPIFPIYVADGQHGYLEQTAYPKPGDKNPEVRIGITSVENPTIVWADFNQKDDQYFGTPIWTPDNKLWISWMNRDQNILRVYDIALNTGAKKLVYEETQKTWIDLDENARFYFLEGNNGFIVKSDKDGWENLYLYDNQGNFKNQITTGNNWGTSIVKVDVKKGEIYYRARKENSARFDFYRATLDGKSSKRLTFGEYSHDAISLSPNAKYFITTYSNLSTPNTMALVDVKKGTVVREIANIKGTEFEHYAIPESKLVRVKSSDGKYDLPVVITYPVNFDPNKRYPVLISIYGGPNAGTVYDRWRNPGGINQWWAQEGIIQVAFDNRSSGHFGKIGLNEIHRQLGLWEIRDYMDCGKWLRSQPWVDTNKVAITGGSFGGYMTAMALTYGADVFTHGIANASVTDWRLYDTHYTERFMDTPQDNPEGYKNTSVMEYAHKLKGVLRIVHGTTDDNVHMQNSIQLIGKLQELNKTFQFMLYPNERHGIGANDPRKALHNRLEAYRFYYEQLLGKPLPEEFTREQAGPPQQRRGF